MIEAGVGRWQPVTVRSVAADYEFHTGEAIYRRTVAACAELEEKPFLILAKRVHSPPEVLHRATSYVEAIVVPGRSEQKAVSKWSSRRQKAK